MTEEARGIRDGCLCFLAIVLAFILVSLLAGCASAPRVAPRFVQPSTAPIAAQHKAIKEATTSAGKHIEAAKTITLTLHDERDKQAIDALSAELDRASEDVATATARADAAEGARDQLDTQLQAQTATANTLADNYDKAGAQITSLRESRHGWVKWFWYSAALNLAALAWIFRGPLLRIIGL